MSPDSSPPARNEDDAGAGGEVPSDAAAGSPPVASADWLTRHTPREWIYAALAEAGKAEQAFKERDARGGVTGCKRAAGMGLNAALILQPNALWGRKYVDHVVALSLDAKVPDAVRVAAEMVANASVPAGGIVLLRTPKSDERLLEATRDVIAHAYAVVRKYEPDAE